MKILLYCPDNGVTQNFMPHLWMFLLQSITPKPHEVLLIDGNTQPLTDSELVQYIRDNGIDLVGIGAMTRMIAKAYRVADAIRAAGVRVVMGGPHVTEVPNEALGRDGGPRHADSIALGEADETWPKIVEDAARGELKEVYAPVDAFGQDKKPSLENYPAIPWESIDIRQFNRIPRAMRAVMQHYKWDWETFHIIPIESGRGCPYGCEFCTVTGFFGDSIRFRSNQSIVDEMLRIAAGAQLSWVGQISANLLRDEELVDLIAESGGKWIFIGMESLDPANLAAVNKSFNKPGEYAQVLDRLARRHVYAITSFIFGLDNDRPGVGERTLEQIRTWPPVLPVFGQITPFPATPLYDRLLKEGRLTRPKHWLEFAPFQMAHTPHNMAASQVQEEVRYAWLNSYSAEATARSIESIADEPVPYKISHLVARIFFRGIYFPPKTTWGWLKVIAANRGSIFRIVKESFTQWGGAPGRQKKLSFETGERPLEAVVPANAPALEERT
jgi:radical SAM superfamily enzyme YgiQ (UPF0313 family)